MVRGINFYLIRTLFLPEYATLRERGQQLLIPMSLWRSQTFYSGACLTTVKSMWSFWRHLFMPPRWHGCFGHCGSILYYTESLGRKKQI